MYSSKTFPIYGLEVKTFEQVKLIEAKQVRETHNQIKPQAGDGDWVVVILVPISFIVVCATVSSIIFALCKVTRERGNKLNISHCQQVPCSNCRFFSNNHYLKCAVHPSIVSTKQALDCSDYRSQ
jgi:hypothetical protein